MIIEYRPAHVLSYISDAIKQKELKDSMRKFPPNTKVKFTGTIQHEPNKDKVIGKASMTADQIAGYVVKNSVSTNK